MSETKLAGKYDTPEALSQGIVELRKTVGLPELGDRKVFGEGGIYADVAAAELGYKELETLHGKIKSAASPQAPTKPGMQIPAVTNDDEDINAVLSRAGLKGEDLGAEWARSGKLTDDQYAKLKEQGLSKAIVNKMMVGELASAQLNEQQKAAARQSAEALVGGEQQLDNLLAFARTLPPARVADLNVRLADPLRSEGAIKELMYEHQQAVGAGKAQPLITGGTPAATGAKITSAKQFNDVSAKAQRGDKAAIAQLQAMTPAEIEALS